MKYLEKEHNWGIRVKNKYGNDAYLLVSYKGCLKIMKYLEKEHNWDIHIKNNDSDDAYLLASDNKSKCCICNIDNMIKKLIFYYE